MFKLLSLCLIFSFHLSALAENTISGAGSSAAAPLYAKWADAYNKKMKIGLAYQAVGSSAGIKQIKAKTVDFAGSDVAMSVADLKRDDLIQFPSAISGVVPVVNLPGIPTGKLKLTGDLLADIFARKISQWNDPAIVALNPDLKLPKKTIEVIVRQEGSGTTYNFTDYLSKVNAEWQSKYGKDFTIKWHAELIQVKGSSGVSAAVKSTPYAISFIDYNYVLQDNLSYAILKNRDGKFVSPSAEAFAASMNNSGWKSNGRFEEMLTDKPGSNSWPIAMGTFVILQKTATDTEKSIAALKFFTWSFMNGDHLVRTVDMVRLPDSIQARIFKEMTTVTDTKGKPLQWMNFP
ncbi:phosphate ABC transporter substrate-binding protein PstS [Undibacterium sp. FT147W]|uniref:Phosphate-binding protein PstS n=1 Tax=Undibacterium rivi TaxID=2828729 RepID=A0ABS5GXR7_9BURK|nr:phosphate ABC transporter substrate-binding protein PstS [Undibacterium rivi]MBR7791256.1 phosphate ABC transporter substrate-binding protein PstS [Undibacterium rivi]